MLLNRPNQNLVPVSTKKRILFLFEILYLIQDIGIKLDFTLYSLILNTYDIFTTYFVKQMLTILKIQNIKKESFS